jgi:hypothetical protein
MGKIDRLLPFHIGAMNRREARESEEKEAPQVSAERSFAVSLLTVVFLSCPSASSVGEFGERNYSSDAPGRREDRYCVGDIPKEVLNNRLKWAESL